MSDSVYPHRRFSLPKHLDGLDLRDPLHVLIASGGTDNGGSESSISLDGSPVVFTTLPPSPLLSCPPPSSPDFSLLSSELPINITRVVYSEGELALTCSASCEGETCDWVKMLLIKLHGMLPPPSPSPSPSPQLPHQSPGSLRDLVPPVSWLWLLLQGWP